MGKFNRKDDEKKESFFKKHCGIIKNCILMIVFSIAINIFGYIKLPKIIIRVLNGNFKSNNSFCIWIVYLVACFIISILFLKILYKTKNKKSNEGTDYRFVMDIIFIVELFIVVSYLINLSLFVINKYFLEINVEKYSNLLFFVLAFFTISYFLSNILKNLVKIKSLLFILVVLSFFITGWVSAERFLIVSLIMAFVNQLLSDSEYLYYSFNKDTERIDIDKKELSIKTAYWKLYINITALMVYIFLALTDYFIIIESNPSNDISKEIFAIGKMVNTVSAIFCKGAYRAILFCIILLVIEFYLKRKKKSLQEEILKLKKEFENKLMRFMEKYIIK